MVYRGHGQLSYLMYHSLITKRQRNTAWLTRRRSYQLSLTEVRSSAGCSHTNQGKDLNLISSTLSVSYTHYSVVVLTKWYITFTQS